jgi:hypothetical protein
MSSCYLQQCGDVDRITSRRLAEVLDNTLVQAVVSPVAKLGCCISLLRCSSTLGAVFLCTRWAIAPVLDSMSFITLKTWH